MWAWDETNTSIDHIKNRLSNNPESHTGFVSIKCGGVYALVAANSVTDSPSIAAGVITIPDGATVRYTLDGSDPRYSDSAKDYTAATELTAEQGCKIRAYAVKAGLYPSPVVEGA